MEPARAWNNNTEIKAIGKFWVVVVTSAPGIEARIPDSQKLLRTESLEKIRISFWK